jgi:hypothetical protein
MLTNSEIERLIAKLYESMHTGRVSLDVEEFQNIIRGLELMLAVRSVQ